jgi:hypothetical protein
MKLTADQLALLRILDDGPLTTSQIIDATWIREGTGHFSFDRVHASMRRLENRELVRRVYFRPNRWELTAGGRKAIA